jgi:hypothetical protein
MRCPVQDWVFENEDRERFTEEDERRGELEDIFEKAFQYAYVDVDGHNAPAGLASECLRMFKAYLDNQMLDLEDKMWMLVKLDDDDRFMF